MQTQYYQRYLCLSEDYWKTGPLCYSTRSSDYWNWILHTLSEWCDGCYLLKNTVQRVDIIQYVLRVLMSFEKEKMGLCKTVNIIHFSGCFLCMCIVCFSLLNTAYANVTLSSCGWDMHSESNCTLDGSSSCNKFIMLDNKCTLNCTEKKETILVCETRDTLESFPAIDDDDIRRRIVSV